MIFNTKVFNTRAWKILEYFFEHPYEEIYLAKLSETTKVNVFTTKQIVDELVINGFLIQKKLGKMRILKANTESLLFRYLKIYYTLMKLEKSGLVEYLLKKISNVSSILLFGSGAKGEDTEKSDIDILVIGKKKSKLNLEKFEKKLKRKIQLFVFSWSEWKRYANKNKAFYQEVISYSIELYGFKPVVE